MSEARKQKVTDQSKALDTIITDTLRNSPRTRDLGTMIIGRLLSVAEEEGLDIGEEPFISLSNVQTTYYTDNLRERLEAMGFKPSFGEFMAMVGQLFLYNGSHLYKSNVDGVPPVKFHLERDEGGLIKLFMGGEVILDTPTVPSFFDLVNVWDRTLDEKLPIY